MNQPRRVVEFVVWSTVCLLAASLLAWCTNTSWFPFDRINLISDVFTVDASTGAVKPIQKANPSSLNASSSVRSFDRFNTPGRIIEFSTDSTQYALPQFIVKLHRLRTSGKGKVRIAYFGDSMIEGDLMTQTLRQLLQATFGGVGVGYVPITSIVSGFRQTVRAEYSNGWMDLNFKNSQASTALYLSGHAFRSQSDWVRFTDRTLGDGSTLLQKYLLCGPDSQASILVNQQAKVLDAPKPFNRVLIASDVARTLSLNASLHTPTLFGISFESPDGVVVDNFSFRGITGIELAKLSFNWLRNIHQAQPYDLIVFQYGVNLLFRPMDKDFRWYGNAMRPVIDRFKQAFPTADVLVVSTADRAFRYQGNYASSIGIDSLVRVQASLAFASGIAFYNQFATMGGTNSIVEWASKNPPWAGRDYVHPNARGAEWLGKALYEALMLDYRLYVQSLKKESTPQ